MNEMEFRRRGSMLVPAGTANAMPAREPAADALPLVTQVLSVLRRRKWIIIGAVVAMFLLGLLVTMLMTPQYTASATLEIQRDNGNFIELEGVQPKTNLVDLEFYETQYGLLQSRSLAERVASQLRLVDNYPFFEQFDPSQGKKLFDGAQPRRDAASRNLRRRAAGDALLKRFVIKPGRQSRLVDISFVSPDPALSKRVIDVWASEFVQVTLERKFEATSYARKFLESRLAQLRIRIKDSEQALVAYASREGIVNLPATVPSTGQGQMSGERSLVADDLANLNRELATATAARVEAESRLSAKGSEVTEALENPAIATLRQRRAEAAADYAKLLTQFEPRYPPALALKGQLDQLDSSIQREETRVKNTLRGTFQSSRQRERELRTQVEGLKEGVLDLRRRSIQYNLYERDVDTNRQLYDALLQRYKEIGVAGGVGVDNIAVVDPADTPQRPSSPRLLLNLGLALISGLLLGVAIALALEQIDQGFSDPADVEGAVGLPLLGTIPKSSSEARAADEILDPKSILSEAYQSLQTSLAFSTDHGIPKSIAVTSTRAGEGKSTTSYALAVLIARSRRRVLLLDADMRSPSVHHMAGIGNEQGLSNYLAGADEIDGLIRPTVQEGLFTITAGPQPPSAPDLLASDRLHHLLQVLGQRYDHIVIDSPPVMGLADAPLVCSNTEGAVFVIESHATQKAMAKVAVGRLANASASLLGVVLTKFDTKRANYGYGYDYGYGYGYGDTNRPARS